MKDGATKSFEQSYNCQAAVDPHCQVIAASRVNQEANNGYFSKENVTYLVQKQIDGYVAAGRIKHGDKPLPAPQGRISKDASLKERIGRKLRTIKGRAIYAKHKAISGPVFRQIKKM